MGTHPDPIGVDEVQFVFIIHTQLKYALPMYWTDYYKTIRSQSYTCRIRYISLKHYSILEFQMWY